MDKALLEYKMKNAGISVNEMCKRLSLSRSAFYRKCNQITEFTHSEIQIIADCLGWDAAMEIFFKKEVS